MEPQVGPRAKEGGQVDERVEAQSIVAVVGQVGHEYTDLGWRNRYRAKGGEGVERKKGKECERAEYILIVLCKKIVIKSKSHFPSSRVCEKLRRRSKSNYCCWDCSGESKQIISQRVMVLKSLTEQLPTGYQYLLSLCKVTQTLAFFLLREITH